MSSLPLNISVEIEVIFEVVPEAAEQDELRQRVGKLERKLAAMTARSAPAQLSINAAI